MAKTKCSSAAEARQSAIARRVHRSGQPATSGVPRRGDPRERCIGKHQFPLVRVQRLDHARARHPHRHVAGDRHELALDQHAASGLHGTDDPGGDQQQHDDYANDVSQPHGDQARALAREGLTRRKHCLETKERRRI